MARLVVSLIFLLALTIGGTAQPAFTQVQLDAEIEFDLPGGQQVGISPLSTRNVLHDIVAVINITTPEKTVLNSQVNTLIPDCPRTTPARANCVTALNVRTSLHAMTAAMHAPPLLDSQINTLLASGQSGWVSALELRTVLHAMVAQIFGNIIVVTNEVPGPSAFLLNNPSYSGGIGLVYTCVRNFYVATTGNDGAIGNQQNPWLTIQHADALARLPGDCINVEPGTYT